MALEILELEEQFGRFWHRLVGGRASWPRFPAAAVSLESERRRLAVLFRAMGGDPGLELAAGAPRTRRHRLRPVQRLGTGEERLLTAERTAELVLLPPVLDCLPEAGLNRELYSWLAAFLAAAPAAGREGEHDPLRRDVAFLRAAALTTARVLAAFPGLRERHRRLAATLLALRPARRLRGVEAEVERAVRMLHGAAGPVASRVTDPEASPLDGPRAPSGYRPFLASPLWGEVRPKHRPARHRARTRSPASPRATRRSRSVGAGAPGGASSAPPGRPTRWP